ncbi:hypothetical protein GGTG_10178 [Gaeumannomyces tritici R3-111a-1]|uniref:Uncharacterized protein n=1 Tax=Gaeumannomyces tritici (strain R3-111a-1) TaxID=644352 RepID=J3P9J8_GAET3|nr:hypothetical protein GGTG_10178 [Gaeumannomyces tritici R3-111a-1]EJT73334.1 hypothetical protein GGTG_10178 [Gaeumannomyces tritici R3-111a-1]
MQQVPEVALEAGFVIAKDAPMEQPISLRSRRGGHASGTGQSQRAVAAPLRYGLGFTVHMAGTTVWNCGIWRGCLPKDVMLQLAKKKEKQASLGKCL